MDELHALVLAEAEDRRKADDEASAYAAAILAAGAKVT